MIGHHTNGKLPLLHCSQDHQVHHHAEDVDGDNDDVDGDDYEGGPEDSKTHVNNDDQAAALHQTEGVHQAGGGGGVEQGGVGGDIGGEGEGGGSGERVVVQGGHDGRN